MPPKSSPASAQVHMNNARVAFERERRRRARVQVHWPLCFLRSGSNEQIETVTHDLSSDGFYCFAGGGAFMPGELCECTLGVPIPQPSGGTRVISVHCVVRVIRIELLPERGIYGLGCRIEDYRFADSANSQTE